MKYPSFENLNLHGSGVGSVGSGEEEWRVIAQEFDSDARRAMKQMASGLKHLLYMGLVWFIGISNLKIYRSPFSSLPVGEVNTQDQFESS